VIVVKDDVLPQSMISSIVDYYIKNPDRLLGNWYTEMFDWQQELVNQAKSFFDLSEMIGFESWGHIHSRPDWHVDRDELAFKNGLEERPICSIVFYPLIKIISGGEFVTGTESIQPRTNRAIFFSSGTIHSVQPWRGDRISVALNPWGFLPYTYRYK